MYKRDALVPFSPEHGQYLRGATANGSLSHHREAWNQAGHHIMSMDPL